MWNDFLVKLHITGSTFLISGQYLHLPRRVHTGVCVFLVSCVTGGYWIVALVKYSLTFGSLLKPIKGFSVKIWLQSGLLLMMFQFLCMMPLILGFIGLKLVTITGVFTGVLTLTSSKSS